MKKICLIFFVLLSGNSWAEVCKQTSAQNKQVSNMGELEKELTRQLCFEVVPGEKRYSDKSCDKAIKCSNLIKNEYHDATPGMIASDIKEKISSDYVEKALRENFEKMEKLKKQIDLAKKLGAAIPDSCKNKNLYEIKAEDKQGILCDEKAFNKGFDTFKENQSDKSIDLNKYASEKYEIEFALLDECFKSSTEETLEKKISECASKDPFLGLESGLDIKKEMKDFLRIKEKETEESNYVLGSIHELFRNNISDFRRHVAKKILTDSYCQSVPSAQNICENAWDITFDGFKADMDKNLFIDPKSFLMSVKMEDDREKFLAYEKQAKSKFFDVNNMFSERSYLLMLDSERCQDMPWDQIISLDTPTETATQLSQIGNQGIFASSKDNRYVPKSKSKTNPIEVVSPDSSAVPVKKIDHSDAKAETKIETKTETKNETTKPQETTQPLNAPIASKNQYQAPMASQPISQQYVNQFAQENASSNLASKVQVPTHVPASAPIQSEANSSLPSSSIASAETSFAISSSSKSTEAELSKLKDELNSLKSNLNNPDKASVSKSTSESGIDNQSSIVSNVHKASNDQTDQSAIKEKDNGSNFIKPEQLTDYNKEVVRSSAQPPGQAQASTASSVGGQASRTGLVLTKAEELTPEKANEAISKNEPIYIEENGMIKELSLEIKDGKVLLDVNGKPVYTKIVRGKVGDKKFAGLVKKAGRAPASINTPSTLPDAKKKDEKYDPSRLYQLKNILNKVAK